MSAEFRSEGKIFQSQWVAVCRLPSYRREIDSLFDEIIYRTWGRADWQPDVDVLETAGTYIIEFDLPGTEEKTIQIDVQDRRLTVRGERKIQYPEDMLRMHTSERSAGRFVRTFEFKHLLDPSRIRKFHSNGILTLIIPKQNVGEEI